MHTSGCMRTEVLKLEKPRHAGLFYCDDRHPWLGAGHFGHNAFGVNFGHQQGTCDSVVDVGEGIVLESFSAPVPNLVGDAGHLALENNGVSASLVEGVASVVKAVQRSVDVGVDGGTSHRVGKDHRIKYCVGENIRVKKPAVLPLANNG